MMTGVKLMSASLSFTEHRISGSSEGEEEDMGVQEKKEETKCQEEFVSKWLKWTLGRRPGHRSIWTVFVFDGYDLFPSFRL